jgi:serine/threonine protein kinase/tetratricopeptide (TPR) repeat protein
LFTAFAAWTRDKSRSLATHLVAFGSLDADDRAAVDALANRHLKKYGGKIDRSLAVLSVGRSTQESLARIGGLDVEASLGHVGSARPPARFGTDDPERTGTYSVGSATSDGQRFRIVRPHARGGLGAVFVALDSELDREVALKQILDDRADDAPSRFRFLVEAQITGGLEHPGIVPVYGLGAYSDGRPYYAMRFIRGDSLKEAIEHFHSLSKAAPAGSRDLALRKLLRRFTDVCNAIDYAHSRGVIHRDLKPANIILGKHGETLVVDWGLAKPMGRVEPGADSGERLLMPSSASGSSETLPGSAMGTPAYMSPEQALGDLERLGPRSDVYSLGATLYCLLTGKAPFDGDVFDVIHRVQKGDFPGPRQLDLLIDPALEAICKKAMATKVEERYATCRALADDVDRWMADEPMTAWDEPFARRARRWAKRHRTGVTGAAIAVLAGAVGLAAVLAVQTQANSRLQQANLSLADANNLVTRTNADLKSANDRERERFGLAMEAIKLFHGQVGDDLILKADQFKPLRDKLLRGAADFYGKLEGLLRDQPDRASREAMGNAYFELGELTSNIGDKPAALAVHRKGLAVRRELAARVGATDMARGDVAQSLRAAALLMRQTGDSVEALARYEEASDLLEGLPMSGPGADERRALYGRTCMSIGSLLASTGKPAAAMKAYQRSVETLSRLADEKPAISDYRLRLADSYNNMGFLQVQTGQLEPALASYQQALSVQQKLVDDDATAADFASRLALTHNNIGSLWSTTGEPAKAIESYGRALAIRQRLADLNPAISEFRTRLADSYNSLGALQPQMGHSDEGLESFRQALAIRQKLADENPGVPDFRSRLADSHTGLGWLLLQSGSATAAVAEFSREEAIRTKLARENPSVPVYRDRLANCQTNKAASLLRLGRPTEALELSGRAVALRTTLRKDQPKYPPFRRGLGESLLRSGQARRDLGDTDGAVADWKQADALLEGAGALDGEFTLVHACCHASLSWAAGRPGAAVLGTEARTEATRAMALLRSSAESGFRDIATYRSETALDSLRNRPDFQMLMMDLAMPTRPFAQ